VGEQGLLAWQPASVARERSVTANHAVTGHQNRNGISAYSDAYSAHRSRPADPMRDLAVGGGVTHCDLAQDTPHRLLKERALGVQRRQSDRTPTPEVVI